MCQRACEDGLWIGGLGVAQRGGGSVPAVVAVAVVALLSLSLSSFTIDVVFIFRLVVHQLLATRQRVLGTDHLDTVLALHNLAVQLVSTPGCSEEAFALAVAAALCRQRVLGKAHADAIAAALNAGKVGLLRPRLPRGASICTLLL